MVQPDDAALKKKLDDLSHRLQARIDEFRRMGEFSDARQALVRQIHERRDRLADKISRAEREGTAWKLIESEFERDYSSLFDDLLQFEERLDAETMKQRK